MASIKYEPLASGNKKVVQYKDYSIVVGKTEKGDWIAETKRRKDGIIVTYFPETNHERHFYDYNKTRKAAVEMVMYLIDEFGTVSD